MIKYRNITCHWYNIDIAKNRYLKCRYDTDIDILISVIYRPTSMQRCAAHLSLHSMEVHWITSSHAVDVSSCNCHWLWLVTCSVVQHICQWTLITDADALTFTCTTYMSVKIKWKCSVLTRNFYLSKGMVHNLAQRLLSEFPVKGWKQSVASLLKKILLFFFLKWKLNNK